MRPGRKLVTRVLQVAGLAVAALLVIGSLGTKGASGDYRPSGPPRRLPDEQLAFVTPAEFDSILVGLAGKPVVVNLWASWCPPCRAEMPLLERASDKYRGRVTILGVATNDSVGAARRFMRKVGVTYPNVFDASGDVRRRLGLRGYPTTYFFDSTGVLRASIVGGVTEPRLAAQLRDLLR